MRQLKKLDTSNSVDWEKDLSSHVLHKSISGESVKPDNHAVADFDSIHHVKLNAHLYQFYRAVEDYVNVMSVFFRTGLAKGDACLWIINDAMNFDRVQLLATKLIPNYLMHVCTGQLTLMSAGDWYLSNQRFDQERAVRRGEQFVQKALDRGYSRVRVSADVSVIPKRDRQAFADYEKRIHQAIRLWPVIVVCAYPIFGVSLSETRVILDHHDHMLVGDHRIVSSD